jgi:hypothetical protein
MRQIFSDAREAGLGLLLTAPVTLLEALGDLPPIMAPHHTAALWRRGKQQLQGRVSGTGDSNDSSGDVLLLQQQCVGGTSGAMQRHLDSLRKEGQKAAEAAVEARAGENVPVRFGRILSR